MEIRKVVAIVLKKYSDEILGIAYIKLLTHETVEWVRVQTTLDKYKYNGLLEPRYVLEIELVKSKKNWILKTILSKHIWYKATNYKDYLKFAHFLEIIENHTTEGQELELLTLLSSQDWQDTSTTQFENMLIKHLGF